MMESRILTGKELNLDNSGDWVDLSSGDLHSLVEMAKTAKQSDSQENLKVFELVHL